MFIFNVNIGSEMALIRDLTRYLKETLDVAAVPQGWNKANLLPFFLRSPYEYYQVLLLGTPCLLMLAREGQNATPAVIRNHTVQVQKKWSGEVIYVSREMSSLYRKRLIEQKVAFVVPGNQLYLPPLGIDLREHYRRLRSTRPKLSPATQAAVLYFLLNPGIEEFTPFALSKHLNYSPTTLTRAFNEIESFELGKVVPEGRERPLRINYDRKSLWEKAQVILRDPVRKRIWTESTREIPDMMLAGLSALSFYSSLAEPLQATVALSPKGWKRYEKEVTELAPLYMGPAPGVTEIQVWSYDPRLFASQHAVDPFSLYLSLRNDPDERVEMALQQMMEAIQW